ncbi:PTS sugar transporter subunit IIA [Rhodalgimonas zhirmunskyi]|uniref:PTS sugar transporter subunit IIA n=1 Tax=Rhodalgimonas zhirmunskyi TaxID=2964767 RepID=A0AAJ1U7A5_9RHOB|nr:PTS sugar transporter subunit IIA [Rhodoalgimonas zhirmunskyi]MDQ2094274.1 PTS sugar transporter subunit IIA [Rhodoalgimonas zhirmunskyi]
MEMTTILKPEAVRVIASASSKKRLFHELGEIANAAYGLDPGVVVAALLDRENLGPTGVGHGVALPHARVPSINEVRGVFVLLEKPVSFDSVDRQPVDIAFALFAPEEAGVEHLKALARVSRTLRNEAICQKLRANDDAATLYTILTEDDNAKAA